MEVEVSRQLLDTDIRRVQGQLVVAIQNHQILVAKLRSHPENVTVKKQMLDLQKHMKVLNENQKLLVEQMKSKIQANATGNKMAQSARLPKSSPASHQEPVIPVFQANNVMKVVGKKDSTAVQKKPPQGNCTLPKETLVENPPPCLGNRQNAPKTVTYASPPTDCVDSQENQGDLVGLMMKELESLMRSPKLEFMMGLGLIPNDIVVKIQEKMQERKRQQASRSNVSLWNWDSHEHKRRKNVYLRGGSPPLLRKRGRLRREGSAVSFPSSPTSSYEMDRMDQVNLCFHCRIPVTMKEALVCSTCAGHYHSSCVKLEEPLGSATNTWLCGRCTMKEKEKQRLKERNGQLNEEKQQLEERITELSAALACQESRKEELLTDEQNSKECIQRLSNFIHMIQSAEQPT